ncbi:MAG TPA: hypothetical protein VM577_06910 [Anaerovoracaceae bacterium]|nr:hypothetical protein [Anaerovoracaceae bacterium]
MLYVYCPRASAGALELVRALGAHRLRRFDGLDFWDRRRRVPIKEGDAIICWGATCPEFDGIKVLNGLMKPVNKLRELEILNEAGIPSITLYDEAPRNVKPDVLIPRTIKHQGGRDVLHRPEYPDFYVLKEDFVAEYRIHSFDGKSIRAGVKVPRDGFTPVANEKDWRPNENLVHPWVRSFDAGWRVNYDGFKSNARMRKVAHSAVKALGLTFAAVDLAETANGVIKVLECNRAPGIEGGSVMAYAKAIRSWLDGKPEPESVE